MTSYNYVQVITYVYLTVSIHISENTKTTYHKSYNRQQQCFFKGDFGDRFGHFNFGNGHLKSVLNSIKSTLIFTPWLS